MFDCPTADKLRQDEERASWSFFTHLYNRVGGMYQEVLMNETLDTPNQIITFNLYDFAGRPTGYLQYNWRGIKKKQNCPKEGKYFAHTTPYQTAVFGLHYHQIMKPELLVCEGVFDALTAIEAGYNAIAILSNTGKRIKNSLDIQPVTTYAICQGDKPGRQLAKLCDRAVYLPEGEDVNSMGAKAFKEYFEDIREIAG